MSRERTTPGYSTFHYRVRKKAGKPKFCSNKQCTSINPKRFEWALIRGREYSDDPADYISLCPSCHRKYDLTEETRKKLSEVMMGKNRHGRDRRVRGISKDGNVIECETITQAAKMINLKSMSNICSALAGRTKTSGGYRWEYVDLPKGKK